MFIVVKIIKCEDCGSIVEVLAEDSGDACDTHMTLLEPQLDGDKALKHKPVVEIDGDIVNVKVGEVQHPMDDNHYIQFIQVVVGNEIYTKTLNPGEVPEASFTVGADKINANDVIAQQYCNLHGLWSSE